MKMKKTLIFMAAAASVVLTGCTESDLSSDTSLAKESSSAIEFSAKTRSAGLTRAGSAGVIDTDEKLQNSSGFGVFAWNTAATAWDTYDASIAAPNFMYNEEVTYVGSKWGYSPIKYWPNGIDAKNAANSPSNSAQQAAIQNLSFFAYAPYVAVTPSTGEVTGESTWGITALSTNAATTAPIVTYVFKNTTSGTTTYSLLTNENVDLLWGTRKAASDYTETDNSINDADAAGNYKDAAGNYYNTDLTKQVVDETVDFYFKHALAKFGGFTGSIKAVLDIDGNGEGENGFGNWTGSDDTRVTIQSITIKNVAADANTFTIGGKFNIATGTWSDWTKNTSAIVEGGAVSFEITPTTDGANTEIMVAANGATKTTEWNKSGVPTVTAGNILTTANENLAFYLIPGVADQQLKVSVTYQVSTYDANLSASYARTNQTITNVVTLPELKPNKYYTLVLHLGLTSVKFSAEVADWDRVEGGNTEGAEEIWLPSNVVSASTDITLASGNGATVNVANDQATYEINLTGCAQENTVSVKTKTGTGVDNATTTVTYKENATDAVKDDGKAKVALTSITANSTSSPVENVIVIEEKNGDTVVKTTTVTIIQAAANP